MPTAAGPPMEADDNYAPANTTDAAAPFDDQEATNHMTAPVMDDNADNDAQDVLTEAHTPMEAAPAPQNADFNILISTRLGCAICYTIDCMTSTEGINTMTAVTVGETNKIEGASNVTDRFYADTK